MVGRKTLWVFGQSHCLPYNLENKQKGWDTLLANKFNAKLKNFAKSSSDNLYIFSTVLQNANAIKKNDIVIVGWSHPARKSFVYDTVQHKNVLKDSIQYDTKKHKFIRSKGHPKASLTDSLKKVLSMQPKDSGIAYYDNWYKAYFNPAEQKINFQSYLLATKTILPTKKYVPFYFSKASVEDVKHTNKLYVAEFIDKKKVAISKSDAHMNDDGHSQWCKILYNKLVLL